MAAMRLGWEDRVLAENVSDNEVPCLSGHGRKNVEPGTTLNPEV